MKTVNMHQAKTHLSRLVDEAVAGQRIIIAKNGKPAVVLIAFKPPKKKLKMGLWKDTDFELPEDFDEPDEELNKLMTEGSIFPDEQQDSRR